MSVEDNKNNVRRIHNLQRIIELLLWLLCRLQLARESVCVEFYDDVELVRMLIDNGALIDKATTDNGQTPLHAASLTGRVEVVRMLIENGHANVNATSIDGQTPLDIATENNHMEIARMLRKHEQKVNELKANNFC